MNRPSDPTKKVCSKCKQEKDKEAFSSCRGGLQSWCKDCTRTANRERSAKRYAEDKEYRRGLLAKKQMYPAAPVAARARQMDKLYGAVVTPAPSPDDPDNW